MAKEEKIVLERTFNIPLRRGFADAPKYRRAKRAVNTLKKFIVRHMKSEDLSLGRHLNMHIWKNGIQDPPHHVKVTARKMDSGRVYVELVGAPVDEVKEKKVSSRKLKSKSLKDKLQETLSASTEGLKKDTEKIVETSAEEVKEEPAVEKTEPKAEKTEPRKEKKVVKKKE